MEVDILNLGATVSSIRFPVNNTLKEMTLTYDNVDDFLNDPFYLGATCGRFANRIAKGKFLLDANSYQLTQNNDGNCLHGGTEGFTHRFWRASEQSTNSILFTLISPDGDQGFPGEVTATVRYTLTSDNALAIDYGATTDQSTIINLCNHCYFNLGETDIHSLNLTINSEDIVVVENCIPTGAARNIKNSAFDFLDTVALKERMANYQDDMLDEMGYDHCYMIDGNMHQAAAELSSNDVKLSVYTNQPGLQLYTAAYLSEPFKPFQALCLEAQNYPDAINHFHFPSPILKPDETYSKQVVYQFTAL